MSVEVVGVIKIKDNARRLFKLVQDLPKKCVEIGEPTGSPNNSRINEDGSDITNAEVGFIVEFMHPRHAQDGGGDTTNLLPGIHMAKQDIIDSVRYSLTDMLQLNKTSYVTMVKDSLKDVGKIGLEHVLEQVVSKYVIDTGQYMNSLRFDVRDNK